MGTSAESRRRGRRSGRATVDHEAVQVLVTPAESRLHCLVQVGDGVVVAHQQATPDQRADTTKDDAQLMNDGLGEVVGSVTSSSCAPPARAAPPTVFPALQSHRDAPLRFPLARSDRCPNNPISRFDLEVPHRHPAEGRTPRGGARLVRTASSSSDCPGGIESSSPSTRGRSHR
jgi:hypothetical protein